MSREVRSILFLLFVAVFLAVGPAVILWSQGYRFDKETRRLVQIGAIFLKTDPEKADISVREVGGHWSSERAVGPSLIYTGVFFKDLLPKTYDVRVSGGDEYFPWEKKLTVDPLGVAKATHVVLFPKEVTGTTLANATGIQAFWPDPDLAWLYFEKKGSPTLFRIRVKDPRAKPEPLFNLRSLSGGSPVRDILFSAAGKNAILLLDSGEAILWLPDKTPQAKLASRYLNRFLTEAGVEIPSLTYFWHPTDPDRFFVLPSSGRQGFYRVNTAIDEFQRISRDRLKAFGVGRQNSYFLTSAGDLFRLNQDGEPSLVASYKKENLPQSGFFEIWEVSGDVFVLEETTSGALYLLEKDFVTKISDKSTHASFSPDMAKLAFVDGKTLSLYFVLRMSDDFLVDGRTKIQLKEIDTLPDKLFWFSDNWHLLFLFKNGVEIVETDFRKPLHSWSPALFYAADGVPRTIDALEHAYFGAKENTLFSLKDGVLRGWKLR